MGCQNGPSYYIILLRYKDGGEKAAALGVDRCAGDTGGDVLGGKAIRAAGT